MKLITSTILLLVLVIAGAILGFKLDGNSNVIRPQKDHVEKSKKPNIILILVDDMGREVLGSYGSAIYHTPNIDWLAENGVKFENMFAQPLCTPSRVKIMTGEYNFRNYTDFGYLNPNQTTFANILKGAGYTTMIAGKWQLNGRSEKHKSQGWWSRNRPYHFGFDEYCLWQVARRGSRYADPLIIENGKQLTTDKNDYGPDIFNNFVLNFIDKHQNDGKPFFIYYPMVLVHSPFVPTPDSPQWKNPSERFNDKNKYFKDEVAYCNKLVGKVMDKLKQTGLAKNTLVIFLGDNGTNVRIKSKMENGQVVQGMKGYMVDWGIRVPAIAYWKGISQVGVTNKDMLDFTDVLPTLEEAAGIHNPVTKVVDGHSFLPAILGRPHYSSQYIYMYYKPAWSRHLGRGVFARTNTYKLYGDGRFYNTKKDIREQHPISTKAMTKKQLKIRKKLQQVLNQKPMLKEGHELEKIQAQWH
jgi:arylsulfatase A